MGGAGGQEEDAGSLRFEIEELSEEFAVSLQDFEGVSARHDKAVVALEAELVQSEFAASVKVATAAAALAAAHQSSAAELSEFASRHATMVEDHDKLTKAALAEHAERASEQAAAMIRLEVAAVEAAAAAADEHAEVIAVLGAEHVIKLAEVSAEQANAMTLLVRSESMQQAELLRADHASHLEKEQENHTESLSMNETTMAAEHKMALEAAMTAMATMAANHEAALAAVQESGVDTSSAASVAALSDGHAEVHAALKAEYETKLADFSTWHEVDRTNEKFLLEALDAAVVEAAALERSLEESAYFVDAAGTADKLTPPRLRRRSIAEQEHLQHEMERAGLEEDEEEDDQSTTSSPADASELAALGVEHDIKIAELSAGHAEELATQKAAMATEHAAAVSALGMKHDVALSIAQQLVQEVEAAVRATVEPVNIRAENPRRRRLSIAEQDHIEDEVQKAALEEDESDNAEKVTDHKDEDVASADGTTMKAATTALKIEHDTKLAQLSAEHMTAMALTRTQSEKLVESIDVKHFSHLEEEHEGHMEELDTLRAVLAAEHMQAVSALKADISNAAAIHDAAAALHEAAIAELSARHAEAVSGWESKLSAADEESEAKLSRATAEHEEALVAAKAAHEQLVAASSEGESALAAEHERQASEAAAASEARLAEAAATHDAAAALHEAATAELSARHAEAVSGWESKLSAADEEGDLKLAELAAECEASVFTAGVAYEERLVSSQDAASAAHECAMLELSESHAVLLLEVHRQYTNAIAEHDANLSAAPESVRPPPLTKGPPPPISPVAR